MASTGTSRPRAVIDTSTLVSGRHRRELQKQAALGRFVPIWSPWIVGELHRVLTWRWLAHTHNFGGANWRQCSRASAIMMELLLTVFETVSPTPPYAAPWPRLNDPWDIPVWGTAVVGQADYVVSENRHDFPPLDAANRHIWEGIEYLPGDAFLERLREEWD